MQTDQPDRAPPSAEDAPPRVYRIKITLDLLEPPIWRRLEILADDPIDFVDHAIRIAFGWTSDHASEFVIKGRRYGTATDWVLDRDDWFMQEERRILRKHLPYRQEQDQLKALSVEVFGRDILGDQDAEPEEKSESEDEEQVPLLGELISRARTKFRYRFDFGDDWRLTGEVERIEPAQHGVRYPRCIDGARAHPIEDCGGVWSYAEFIAAAKDPQHGGRARLLEWTRPGWDPEAFSVEDVNQQLRKGFPDV